MSFRAEVLNVLIASPSDTLTARNIVEAAVLSWNRDRARARKVVLLPLRWEFDAVPELGGDAQSIINRQFVDEADIVVGLFYSRLGQPTSRGASGTVEEIERSVKRGAKVHVLFSEMPIPPDVDTDQLTAVREFKRQLQERGLIGSYASHDDLSAKVRTYLEHDVEELVTAPLMIVPLIAPTATDQQARAGAARSGTILRARYEFDREPEIDSRGRMRMTTRRERLVVENLGTEAAQDLEIEIEPVGEGDPPLLLEDELRAERLPPGGRVVFLLALHMGVASQWRVTYRWREGDNRFEDSQSISAF